ncbi:MAG: DUF3810 domain-containing protein, partial [Lachnospiraceae bacterium]|nr:DUF3810 domain-containing protein [Lachnospiraceae bacterium]
KPRAVGRKPRAEAHEPKRKGGSLRTEAVKGESALRRFVVSAIFCLTAFAMRVAVRAEPAFANVYATHMNAFWVNTLGRFSSLFGFSLVEILIYLLLVLAVVLLVRIIRGNVIRIRSRARQDSDSLQTQKYQDNVILTRSRARQGKAQGFRPYGKDELLLVLFLASLIFLLFECNEDMYFDRTTFSDTYGYGQGSYSTENLETVCRMLVDKSNALSDQVARNEAGIMQCDDGIRGRVRRSMITLGTEYPYLGGWYPKAKPLLISQLLSYSSMTGIYSAYTIEANYNAEMTPYNIPYTMCHELSHLKGVMQENQANFCAYLACIGSEDADILYSGYLTAWVYCGNELYRRDYDSWKKLAGELRHSCNVDLQDNNDFWAAHEGKVSEATESFNDSWLKSHGQKDGTLSYDKVVDLIISYEMEKKDDRESG